MPELLINLEKIAFNYPNGKQVFEDISFSFYDNQCLGLVGSNGSGKTTLLQIIMGLIKPQKGTVSLFGKTCLSEKDFKQVRMNIGFVFQDANDQLFCPTVSDDIAFGPINMGLSKKEVQSVVKETLELLGLEDFHDRPTYGLSDGEKKLISIGTVLSMKPKMLILDEPTNCLDEDAIIRITNILLNCKLPYIIVAHDKSFLEKVVKEYLFMNKGQTKFQYKQRPLHNY